MLLAIDIGNTDFKVGVWNGKNWKRIYRDALPKSFKTPPMFFSLLGNDGISGAVCASVVPAANDTIAKEVQRSLGLELVFLDASLPLGIKIEYLSPETLGADRLANALAVMAKASKGIAVDVGTATKIEAVSQETYLGGVILPGLNMSAQALSSGTAQLPPVELKAPKNPIGVDTKTALQSGILHGHAAAIDGMIARFAKQMSLKSPPEVFLTGGQAELLKPLLTIPALLIPTLTLDGLVETGKRLGLT